ncbi:MAG: hypothetical protein JWQ72_1209, partial [Polaromonas sp.]|nr:hypothetical protein [Polaromonas sp.]
GLSEPHFLMMEHQANAGGVSTSQR